MSRLRFWHSLLEVKYQRTGKSTRGDIWAKVGHPLFDCVGKSVFDIRVEEDYCAKSDQDLGNVADRSDAADLAPQEAGTGYLARSRNITPEAHDIRVA